MSQAPMKIRSFWDQKARENPYWYVSSYGDYNNRNIDEFWASGAMIWGGLKRTIGYCPKLNDHVVEIGCGVGRLTRAIAPEVRRIDAFDVSPEMLQIANRASLPNVALQLTDGFELTSCGSHSAELVLAYCVFQHLPSIEALRTYIQEMLRVVKPGGLIAFTLVPRDWRYHVLPALRVRAYLRECFRRAGPQGIYRKQWVGIRPTRKQVHAASPIPLMFTVFLDTQWLFWGIRP